MHLLLIFGLFFASVSQGANNHECTNLHLALSNIDRSTDGLMPALTPSLLSQCLGALLKATNHYDGRSRDNYALFNEDMNNRNINISTQELVLAKLNISLQLFGDINTAKELVNTISWFQYSLNNEIFDIIQIGFGDDDHIAYVFFPQTSLAMFLVGYN